MFRSVSKRTTHDKVALDAKRQRVICSQSVEEQVGGVPQGGGGARRRQAMNDGEKVRRCVAGSHPNGGSHLRARSLDPAVRHGRQSSRDVVVTYLEEAGYDPRIHMPCSVGGWPSSLLWRSTSFVVPVWILPGIRAFLLDEAGVFDAFGDVLLLRAAADGKRPGIAEIKHVELLRPAQGEDLLELGVEAFLFLGSKSKSSPSPRTLSRFLKLRPT